ncbi:heat-shock protein, partial [Trifolium medium]|nr:heat-shock protein [Trifolium medium]
LISFWVRSCEGVQDAFDYNSEEKLLQPQEIYAMILQKLKNMVEDFLGTTVVDAVVSVPTSFNMVPHQTIREAEMISGLNVLRLINDPTATALNYMCI